MRLAVRRCRGPDRRALEGSRIAHAVDCRHDRGARIECPQRVLDHRQFRRADQIRLVDDEQRREAGLGCEVFGHARIVALEGAGVDDHKHMLIPDQRPDVVAVENVQQGGDIGNPAGLDQDAVWCPLGVTVLSWTARSWRNEQQMQPLGSSTTSAPRPLSSDPSTPTALKSLTSTIVR